jgi:hypothetical protein
MLTAWPWCWRALQRERRGPQAAGHRGCRARQPPDRRTCVTINAFWRHSRMKQYLEDSRALRIETVVNSPR